MPPLQPDNPTGALPTPDEWARVGQLCATHGVRIFSDEMYRGLEGLPTTAGQGAADAGAGAGAGAGATTHRAPGH